MVGLSDIPCIGRIVDRISDATIDPLFRAFSYVFCYKDYVNKLNSEIGKLTDQEERVSRRANAEKDNGKTLYSNVPKWQTDVEEFQRSAAEFSDKYKNRASWRCFRFLPIPKPLSRFQLGREAAQKFKRVCELSDSGKVLMATEIAYHPPLENAPISDTVFQDFESRKNCYMNLWEALVTEGSSFILGIYGMPGVGKTRMMEQLWKEAKEKKIFDKVARADVGSDSLDVIKLQNQIAGHLGCHFESQDNLEGRASQLKNCLMNGGKVLVILDDVWRQIPLLDVIGISSIGDSSCKGLKILLTSRKKDVCLHNNCKNPIKITMLTVDEAWALFRNTVDADHSDCMLDIPLAQKVCQKCKGLPLLIRSVGKALQFAPQESWKDALDQLEKGMVEKIADIDPQVYACVKLSIDKLPDDAKSCLFLCSLYPEDAIIYIRKLIQIATGSQLVIGGESRVCIGGESRVCNMVEYLRSSSLLLDGEEDEGHKIKLHDLIRDVARSMAVSDPKYAFSLVKCGLRLPDIPDYRSCKLLHLHLEKNEFCFPDDLVCPELHKLWLQCYGHIQQLSGGFFTMFVNLRFLLIEGMSCSSELQFSLHSLGQLRTLILDDCYLTEVSQENDGFFPENLEILCFWDCRLPKPLDLPNLKYLQKLEIRGSSGRNYSNYSNYNKVKMLPNTISSLPNLEQLHIPLVYEIQDNSWAPISIEISKLRHLRSLQMCFCWKSESFQGTNIFDDLLEYDILVNLNRRYECNTSGLDSSVSIKRSIGLKGIQLEGLESLIERAENVILEEIDINVCSMWNSNRKAFSDLRYMYLSKCHSMGCIARVSEDEIHNTCQQLTAFSKLTNLEIWDCCKLEYLFSKSVAKGLVQLHQLKLSNCSDLEAVVKNEDTNDEDIINFSKLKSLRLYGLRRLKSFNWEKEDRHTSFFDGTVAFPSLENLWIRSLEVTDIWGKYSCTDDGSSFCKLKSLEVDFCFKLETVIPPAMLNRMRNLETILISECWNLRNVFSPCIARDLIHIKLMEVTQCMRVREIIGTDEQEITDGIVFPELTVLRLTKLPNLTSFWCYHTREDSNYYKVEFPNLVDLDLGCDQINLGAKELGIDDFTWQQLKVLKVTNCRCSVALSLSVFRSLPLLQNLKISDCSSLKQIVEDIRGDEVSDMDEKTVTLPQLKCFTLARLPKLKKFIFNANFECYMPALTSVEVQDCSISSLFTSSASRSLPQLQELYIRNCYMLEEIVESGRGDEASGMDKKTITLVQLRSVFLTDLPKLKSFISSANYECHMPALTEVTIDNCGITSLFTFSAFRSLPQLQKLVIRNCSRLEEIVEGGRGDEASGMDKKTITLVQLRSVILTCLPKLKSFISSANYECHMPALTEVRIDNCGISSLFTFSAFRSLPQLQELVIRNCSVLEEIVEGARGDETVGMDKKTITLFQMRVVILENLPNLKSFISSANYEWYMPALTTVEIINCGLLIQFDISRCRLLESIVDDVGDDDTNCDARFAGQPTGPPTGSLVPEHGSTSTRIATGHVPIHYFRHTPSDVFQSRPLPYPYDK